MLAANGPTSWTDALQVVRDTLRIGTSHDVSSSRSLQLGASRPSRCLQAVRDELQAQLDPAELARYAIRSGDAEFEEALGGKVHCLELGPDAFIRQSNIDRTSYK